MKIFRLIGALIWAIPATFIWNALAPTYLNQLPSQYLDLPYLHVAGLFLLIRIVSIVVHPHSRHCGGWHKFRGFKKMYRRGRNQRYIHPEMKA